MATALDLISGAMRLFGALAEGEVPTPAQSYDGLEALNAWIDSLNTQGVIIHASQMQDIEWVPGGTSSGPRPIEIRSASFSYPGGDSDFDLELKGSDEYATISAPATTGTPAYLYVNYTNPHIELELYPVPVEAITVHLQHPLELAQFVELNEEFVFPPGYYRALKFGFAVEFAPEFGMEAPLSVQKSAWQAMRWIKRLNVKNKLGNKTRLPYPLSSTTASIYEG